METNLIPRSKKYFRCICWNVVLLLEWSALSVGKIFWISFPSSVHIAPIDYLKSPAMYWRRETEYLRSVTQCWRRKKQYWRRWTEYWQRKTQYWWRLTHNWWRKHSIDGGEQIPTVWWRATLVNIIISLMILGSWSLKLVIWKNFGKPRFPRSKLYFPGPWLFVTHRAKHVTAWVQPPPPPTPHSKMLFQLPSAQ